MNIFNLSLAILSLLVLVTFNHAHGLTTFGKTQQVSPNVRPHVQLKVCINQMNCTLIKGTTCLKGYCLCGDNTHPVNGGCKTTYQGPRHICENDDECVEGADCKPYNENISKDKTMQKLKTCMCQEGYFEAPGGVCGDATQVAVNIWVISLVSLQLLIQCLFI